MNFSDKLKYVWHWKKHILALGRHGLLNWMPDKMYLTLAYQNVFGKKPDFKNPKTYNEKLQWLKLYDHRQEYTALVDKYQVREYIKQTIGEKYLIPLLGVWSKPEDIDIDKLPNQFVLKCNHDSGSIVICLDKSKFDFDEAKKKLRNHIKNTTFQVGREWPYKNVVPCIIAEQYMEDSSTRELRDYKFFAFNGRVEALFIATDRQSSTKPTAFDFFDREFKHLDIRHGHPNAEVPPEKPKCFDEMLRLAEQLSAGLPQVRVDFYEVNGKVYFGEMTFFHHSGFTPFDPEKWDRIFGEWIVLPNKTV